MYQTLLKHLERDSLRNFQAVRAPITNWLRNAAFTKTEAAGIDMTGQWNENRLIRNDLDAFQDASLVHSFVDNF